MKKPIIVAYGGGTNSTALLVGMKERGIVPDLIIFADTGGEKPKTIDHVAEVSAWCESIGFPKILTVKGSQPQQVADGGLYEECIRLKVLPSRTYGFGSCSMKWKKDPQDKYVKAWCKENGHKQIIKFIGYDADESRRSNKINDNDWEDYQFPLIEWDWGRDECIEAIKRAGLNLPGKSSCFFCPSMKPNEIRLLKKENSDLFDKAVFMEQNMVAHTVKGLGRNWAWGDMIKFEESQLDLFRNDMDIPCGCYDGE
jgi:hypothetical protein